MSNSNKYSSANSKSNGNKTISKNRNNLSFFSAKTFLEDEIEINDDLKKENHELN